MTTVISIFAIAWGFVLIMARNKMGASASKFYRRIKLPSAEPQTYSALFAVVGTGAILFGIGSLVFAHLN